MPNPHEHIEKPEIADQFHTIPYDGIGEPGGESTASRLRRRRRRTQKPSPQRPKATPLQQTEAGKVTHQIEPRSEPGGSGEEAATEVARAEESTRARGDRRGEERARLGVGGEACGVSVGQARPRWLTRREEAAWGGEAGQGRRVEGGRGGLLCAGA
nr:unnamed protein product [Digitaria exilis]